MAFSHLFYMHVLLFTSFVVCQFLILANQISEKRGTTEKQSYNFDVLFLGISAVILRPRSYRIKIVCGPKFCEDCFFFHEMLKMKKTRIKCIKLRLKAPAPSSTREFYKYYHFMFIRIDSHFQRHTLTHTPHEHFYRMLSSTSFCSFSSFFLSWDLALASHLIE